MNLNWKQIINTVKEDDRFYMDTEEDEVCRWRTRRLGLLIRSLQVTPKEAGWEFLRMFGNDDEEDMDNEEDDSEFSDAEEEQEASDDESEVEAMDSEAEDSEDYDEEAEDELEEHGMDWDDLEEESSIHDKRKRKIDEGGEGEVERKPRRPNGGVKRRR